MCLGGSGVGGGGGGTSGVGGGGGGSGGGGGAGGGSSGTGGGFSAVDHLDLTPQLVQADAGTCVPYTLQAKDSMGTPTTYFGPTLTYALLPVDREVLTYLDSSCTLAPSQYVTGPIVQSGSLLQPYFGKATVFPTITSSAGYSQGRAVVVEAYATLSGFPSQLAYGVCTPVTLTATAAALDDTTLSRATMGGTIAFSQALTCAGSVPVFIAKGAKSTTVRVRTTTGGKIHISGSPDVLQFDPVSVTLTKPDGGFPCVNPGASCQDGDDCCSLICELSGFCR